MICITTHTTRPLPFVVRASSSPHPLGPRAIQSVRRSCVLKRYYSTTGTQYGPIEIDSRGREAVSQSISKCAREIGPTVSQFLNVHGKFSASQVSVLGFTSQQGVRHWWAVHHASHVSQGPKQAVRSFFGAKSQTFVWSVTQDGSHVD